jgi:hypothetical protein
MLPASVYLTAPQGARFPTAVESDFYKGIKTSNGTRKTTSPLRLDAINALFFDTLKRLQITPYTVMDVGISSGVTTLEWLNEFKEAGLKVSMIATDFVMSVYLVRIGRALKVLVERNGHLLQIEFFGIGLRTYTRWRDYLLGGFIWRNALCSFLRSKLSTRPWDGPYYLVSPLLRDCPDIIFRDDNILEPNPPDLIGCADVIRIANLLQRAYFSEHEIKLGLQHLRERCRGEGSLIIVCRNSRWRIDGSILRMTNARQFVVEARIGRGSEVEQFFTGARE